MHGHPQEVAGTIVNPFTKRTIASVPTGDNPSGLAVDRGAGRVYVTNFGSNTVSVVNALTNKVVATIDTGRGPIAVAVQPRW
jgi:YVTN family beta-propeller protein